MNNTASLIYSPFPNEASARKAAHGLLEQTLIACANLLPGATSIYPWEGAVAEETETILIAKTSAALADKAASALHALHPYDVPAIITLADASILPDYAHWLGNRLANSEH